jgi:streptogramin lyase
MVARGNLSLVGIFTALIILSTLAPIQSISAATIQSNVHTEAVSPIQKFSLTEWTVPTSAAGPFGIGTDTNGRVWLTENATNKLARFDPSNNNFTEWNVTTPNSQPRNIFVKQVTVGTLSVTQVFFTEFAANKIARFDSSTNNLTEWVLSAGSNPTSIYVDEKNDIWFTESGRDIVARLITNTNTLTEWTLPGATTTAGSPLLEPSGIYVQVVTRPTYSNRFVWFTETLGNKIGRLEVTSNVLTIWDLSKLGLGSYSPTDIIQGVYQTLPVAIITDVSNKISVLGNDTGGGSLYQETVLPSLNSGPMGLAYDSPRNAAWFAENNVGKIANLNTTSVLAGQLLTPTYCTMPPQTGSTLCTSPSTTVVANITSTVSTVTGVSVIETPAASSTVNISQGLAIAEYKLPTNNSRPTQVAIDSTGNVWFTENNATVNRIGRFSIPYILQLSASPNIRNINPGQTTTFSVNVTLVSGFPQPVQLSLINAPAGVTAVYSPQTQIPPFSSTLIFTTTNSTPTGTFPMSIKARSGSLVLSTAITLGIQTPKAPPFDFSVSLIGATTATVIQGGSASFNVKVALTSGSPKTVSLTASGFPSSVSYSFMNSTGTPPFITTLNVFTGVYTAGGTYQITVTGMSGNLTHAAIPTATLTITELPRDFNLTASATQILLVQSSKTVITLTVASVGYFNGNVTLSSAVSPSQSGLTVNFTPSSTVTPQPNGGIAQIAMGITAQKNTVGTYQLTITGSSSTPSRTHQLTITVQVSPCLIATATYGSELAPQVQFLRDFRDQQIMHTFAGSNFMTAFNAWYYSFSPAVAQYEYSHPYARAMAKSFLYPLIGILQLSSSTFTLFGPTPEFAALAAGLIAGALIGLAYGSLPSFWALWFIRRKISVQTKRRVSMIMTTLFALLLCLFLSSEILVLPSAMMLSSAGLVLAALLAGSLLPALYAVEYIKRRT